MKLRKLQTRIIGRNLYYYKEIDSTQLEAWRNTKLESGSIVLADAQTDGKGTHGRVWYKNCKKDISFSLKINANCHIEDLQNITIDIANIIVDIFYDLYKISLQVKKPNDIMLNGKKLGGILTETKLNGTYVKEIVVGIGLNLKKQIFPKQIDKEATSVENELGINIGRVDVITEFCNRFEKNLINRKII